LYQKEKETDNSIVKSKQVTDFFQIFEMCKKSLN